MLSRIGALFSKSLEMLDLSDCDRITAKGLAGLRSLKKLRYLRLEGLDHVKVGLCISLLANLLFQLLRDYHKFKYFVNLLGFDVYSFKRVLQDLAKTAILLEESIPSLRVFGVSYEEALRALQREFKLLKDERIVTDAKGNFVPFRALS